VLGPATTNFNDYLGTVAADDAEAVLYEPCPHELVDLDRDRYTILAVDLRVEGRTTATVYTPPTECRIPTQYPARSGCGAQINATFRWCGSTSRKRVLKNSSGTPSAGSRSDW
jgi:hypothetical protein